MNGELDIFPQSSLRRILSGSNVCHSNLKNYLNPLESSNFSARGEVNDIECSSGVISACSDVPCDEVDCTHNPVVSDPATETAMNRNNSSNASDILVNCPVNDSTVVNNVVTPDIDRNRFSQFNLKSQQFLNVNEADKGTTNGSLLDSVDRSVNSTEASNFLNSRVIGHSKQLLTNTDIPNAQLFDTTFAAELLNAEPQFNFNPNKAKPKLPPSFSVGDIDDDASFSYWGRATSGTDERSSTDPLSQIIGSSADQSLLGIDNTVNPQFGSAVSNTARRPITGGHQNNRIGVPRPTTWSSNSTFPNLSNQNSWGCVNKPNCNSFQTQPSSSGVNASCPSPTWNANQQIKPNQLSNLLNNLSLDSCAPGSTSGRSLTMLNSSSVTPNNSSGLNSIYSMFPKRPQHRMLAHWQQQQHHSGQSLKHAFCSQSAVISHLGCNRAASNGTESNGTSGDNANVTYNGGSVLQAISSISTNNMNSSPIGCSGDTFCTGASNLVVPTESNASLDTFKYGLDQQLMEAIKAFGSNTATTNNPAALDISVGNDAALMLSNLDEQTNSFGDVEQQLSGMSTLNNLSILSQNCSANTAAISGVGSSNASSRTLSGMPVLGSMGFANSYPVFSNVTNREEGYSRKVFVGGLPPDIDEEEITTAFRRFGPLIVDWPHKTESKAYFPPKGYCFLLFQDERSVQNLINACIVDEGKYYWCVSSPTMKDKPVQIRPWNLADSDFVMDGSQPLDPRKTIFVGGVPRPLRAIELALIMDRLYSGVCYAGIDTDPELKYPKGAGRVAFSNQQSYIAAISARFVQLQHNEIDKRVEVKPYVLDNQLCDECQGARCGGKFAPFFCANVACLQYYCEQCWVQIHSRNGREYHKPLVKEGAERPRPALYRW